ncbi:hypothetical protein Mgra_00001755 [Meloidogyne graminicola]|uniref:Uncharacterized protein n=1 Tax=Meloidogyne graminicola TaxID=189291 RepID=A0A8T0A0N7_9BILA|nr:hypothetical protein Mgra_00001755 [Meloidogyne graminicola]
MFLFYDSCLNNLNREKLKSLPLLKFLEKIIGNKRASGELRNFDTEWIIKAFPFIPFFEIETTWNVLKESKEKSMFMFLPKSPFISNNYLIENSTNKIILENKLKTILNYLVNDSLKLQKKLPAFMEEGLNEKEINC